MQENIAQTEKSLSLGLKLAYSGPAFVLTLFGIIFYVYLPKFYAESFGLDLAIIGYIILASRVFDALTDPIIGFISDRASGPGGRRKVFIKYAYLPLAASFYFLLNPLQGLGPELTTVWFASFSFIFFLLWTVVVIPYEAWGPELSSGYDERTRLFTFRDGAVVLGTLFAVILPEALKTLSSDPRVVFQAVGIIYGLLLIAAVLNCLKWVPEKKLAPKKIPVVSIFRGIKEVLGNKNFLILLSSYTVAGFGAAMPATLIFFYVQDVLGSKFGGAFLLLYFLIGFMFVPVWGRLAIVLGKKIAWLWSMIINTGAFMFVLLLSKGDEIQFALLVALSGMGFGGTQIIPSSMQADVIDVDEANFGTRREGQFVGLWAISKKLAAALGAGISLPLLAYYGYQVDPLNTQTQVNSPQALEMLSFLYAGVPCICNIIGILLLTKYSLTKEELSKVRTRIGNADN
jgi:GPH family glycoside/pentoside/hexuronide:cation symporter